MATYTKVSRSVPSSQRAALISAVGEGDQIDIEDVLGRPARKVIFQMADASDTVTYKINHLRRIRTSRPKGETYSEADQVWGVFGTEVINAWSGNADVFTGTGSIVLETVEGLYISSIEIVSLTLTGSPATITISVT
jgi:hypothetical protein